MCKRAAGMERHLGNGENKSLTRIILNKKKDFYEIDFVGFFFIFMSILTFQLLR